MIRKIILFIASILAVVSCNTDRIIDEMNQSNQTIEDKIKENAERIATLERLCSELNSNVEALKVMLEAMQGEDWVKGVTPVRGDDGSVVGYVLEFAKSGTVTIYNGKNGADGKDGKDGEDGKDGYTPVLEIRKDIDGEYYWVLDGKWLSDSSGKRIPALGQAGVTPELRIVDGCWEVSYDGGRMWKNIGKATGEDGTSFFKDVKLTDDGLHLVLSDGTTLTFPQYHQPELSFSVENDEAGAASGIEVNINYVIKKQMPGTTITATSDGNYSVKVIRDSDESGKLVVIPPAVYTDGYVNVIVSDPSGYSLLRVINFHENKINFPEGLEYSISQEGGTLQIPFCVNFDMDIRLYSDWLKMEPATRAEMRDSSIVVTAAKNTSFGLRSAVIYVYSKNNDYQPYSEIVVNQASASFSIKCTKFAIPYIASSVQAEVFSTIGLKVDVESGASWLSYEITKNGNDYLIDFTALKNTAKNNRNGNVALYSERGERIGSIQIIQMSEVSDSPEDMVFTVRANFPNDFTAELPLYGEIDCYVDWGDGSVDYYDSRPVKHRYETDVPSSYVVTVSGKVTSLNSYNISVPSVIEVNQWGKTGLNSVADAFCNNSMLQKVAGCENGELENITSAYRMFSNCYGLGEIPSNLFAGCRNLTDASSAFELCRLLPEIPAGLLRDCVNLESVNSMFSGCTSLKMIPDSLFKECVHLQSVESTFRGCSSLVTVPEELLKNNPAIMDIGNLFRECQSLTEIPVDIFDNNLQVRRIDGLFMGCSNMKCESPYTVINWKKVHLYERNNYLDYFTYVKDHYGTFERSTFSDYENIPDEYK